MKNVKQQIATALLEVTNHTSDSFPSDWTKFPVIQYIEEDNKVSERTDDKEEKAYVRYRIDIWDNKNTSEAALKTDEVISRLGLIRTMCQDVPEQNNIKHKIMRYEGIVDMNSEIVYWSK